MKKTSKLMVLGILFFCCDSQASNGFIESAASPILMPNYGTNDVAVDDMDNDGDMDIVTVGTNFNQIYVQLGNGDGTFAAPLSFSTTLIPNNVGSGPVAVRLINIDVGSLNDKGLDIITVNSDASKPSITVFLNTTTTTFNLSAPNPISSSTLAGLTGTELNALAVGHLANGDVFAAVTSKILPASGWNLIILKSNGLGGFSGLNTIALPCDPNSVQTGQLDPVTNTTEDLIIGCNLDGSSPNILLYSGDGFGGFTQFAAPLSPLTVIGVPTSIGVKDLNHDTHSDLFVTSKKITAGTVSQRGRLTILEGNGSGTFVTNSNSIFDFGTNTTNHSDATAADFFHEDPNNFHREEIAVSDWADGKVHVFQHNENFTFTKFTTSYSVADPRAIASGQLRKKLSNNDERWDIIVGGRTNPTGPPYVSKNTIFLNEAFPTSVSNVSVKKSKDEFVVLSAVGGSFIKIKLNNRSIDQGSSVEILSASGQRVRKIEDVNEGSQIDVEELSNGIYVVQLKYKNKTVGTPQKITIAK